MSDRDREEILALMQEETAAFFRQDFAAMRACWVDSPTSRFMRSYPGMGVSVLRGLDDIMSVLSSSISRTDPTDVTERISYANLSLVISGDMAWASYDQVTRPDGVPLPLVNVQHEMMVFQRLQSGWKIACVVVLAETVAGLPDPLIEVGPDLQVLWVNASARAALVDFRGLVISGHRLRTRRRGDEAALRAAVASTYRVREMAPIKHAVNDRHHAVRLGDGDRGEPIFAWVFAEDGKVMVTFQIPGALDVKLSLAREAFGLSSAQSALAARLIKGQEIADAATDLGISVNTARTQVSRMFDKTGARSQGALIRALLSLRVPTKE